MEEQGEKQEDYSGEPREEPRSHRKTTVGSREVIGRLQWGAERPQEDYSGEPRGRRKTTVGNREVIGRLQWGAERP